MLKRNKESAAPMPSLPQSLQTLKAVVVRCAAMRVDPAHVLGIKPGEAVVMRNIGDRVTPGLLEEFGLLGRIGEVAGTIPGGGGEFHPIVIHHTDCGSTRLVGPIETSCGFVLETGDARLNLTNQGVCPGSRA